MNKLSRQNFKRQRGAALVVGLLLLVILTLLAISGMNTASTELVMAGNEQFRQRAYQAASTGIESAMANLYKTPQVLGDKVASGPVTVAGTDSDQYSTTSEYMGEDLNVPGYSVEKYAGYHYEVTSTGTSARNARMVNTAGAYVIQKVN